MRQQNFDEALTYANELSKHRDHKALGQYFKGRIALGKGQIAEAIPLLQRAIKEAPRLALAHYYLGQAYIKDQKLEQAKLSHKGERTRSKSR